MPMTTLSTGIDIYYEISGEGPPLLLIMGTAADHTTWSSQVNAYKTDFKVITYDARGTGLSTSPDDPSSYSMKVLADDAAALLKVLDIDAAHVSGLSLGSATAQELAINYPELVRSIQLHCTWGRSDDWFCRMIESMELPVIHDDFTSYIRTALLWVASPHFINERPDDVAAFERRFILENPNPPTKTGLLGHFHADKTHNTLDRLHTIKAPTLISSGEMDWQVPTRYGRLVQNEIKHADFLLFTGYQSSHIAFHEMADEWNSRTLAWMKNLLL